LSAEDGFCRGDEEAPGKGWRWGHEEGLADPDIVGLVGAGTEVLARSVKDCLVQCCR